MKSVNQPFGMDWKGVLGRVLLVIALGSVIAGCKAGFGRATDNDLTDVEVTDENGDELDFDPNFDSDETEYTLDDVPRSNDVITFNADLSDDEEASMRISGTGFDSISFGDGDDVTVPLVLGDNEIRIEVEAENEETQTYIFDVERETTLSEDDTLEELTISGAQLDTAFDSETLTYESLVGLDTETVTFNAVPGDIEAASMTIDNTTNTDTTEMVLANGTDVVMDLQIGVNVIQVVVTAENDDVRTYTFNIERSTVQSDDTMLTSLVVEGLSLSSDFDPEVNEYEAETNFLINTAEISWVRSDDSAATKFNDVDVDGAGEGALSLSLGDTIATISVSQGTTEEDYRITITRDDTDGLEVDAYIKSEESEASESFGQAISIDGDTMVIGAPSQDDSNGAVHVVVRDSNGDWGEPLEVTLDSDDQVNGSQFGYAVAVSDDLMAVGAPSAEGGAAYIFTRNGTGWDLQEELNDDLVDGDEFGASLSLIGTRLIVGAPGANDDDGEAYVFNQNGSDWVLDGSAIDASENDDGGRFGAAVAFNQEDLEEVFIGAPIAEGSDDVSSAGAVYVFRKTEGDFEEENIVHADSSITGVKFGAAIAAKGDRLVVGAPQSLDDVNASTGIGSVITFERDGDETDGWDQQEILSPDSDGAMEFGSSVALSSDMLVVGAPLEDSDGDSFADNDNDDADAVNAGAVYLYAFNDDDEEWDLEHYFKAFNSEAGDQFGRAIAISGQTLVVGAPFEDSSDNGIDNDPDNDDRGNDAVESGAVYVIK